MKVFLDRDEVAVAIEYYRACRNPERYSQTHTVWAPCVRCGVAQWWSFEPFDHGSC